MRAFLVFSSGFVLSILIAFISFQIAKIPFVAINTHLAPSAFAILFGLLISPIFFKYKSLLNSGVNFSAKKILRLGIVLYGFHISLGELSQVGIHGAIVATCIIVVIFSLALIFGKILKLDKESSMLVGAGSAICGAAAILALESSIKSKADKGVIAISFIVIFGLLFMFLYPFVYSLGILDLNDYQFGIYMGLSLHEVANVVGAAQIAQSLGLSPEAANVAIIIKMMRVILLVPFLLIICFISSKTTTNKSISIPYFAFAFLVVIFINSYIGQFDYLLGLKVESVVEVGKLLCGFCIVCAMAGLGLQVNIKQFITLGGKAFKLALILSVFLILVGYLLAKIS